MEKPSRSTNANLVTASERLGKIELKIDSFLSTITSLHAKLEQAEKALDLFAKDADRYDPENNDGTVFADDDWAFCDFTFGDMRRARAAYAAIHEKDETK